MFNMNAGKRTNYLLHQKIYTYILSWPSQTWKANQIILDLLEMITIIIELMGYEITELILFAIIRGLSSSPFLCSDDASYLFYKLSKSHTFNPLRSYKKSGEH